MSINREEEWRPVPGYPGIWASSDGQVHKRIEDGAAPGWGARSKPTLGSITTTTKSTGHVYARRYVRWKGWPGNLYVADLVCRAFHGPRPEGHLVMHLDDDSLNNVPSNLRWGTPRDNLNTPTTKLKLDACRREANRIRWEKARAAAA